MTQKPVLQQELIRLLYKEFKVITFAPQTCLISLKESLQNMLELIYFNGSIHIPDLLLGGFSSARVVPVYFPFNVAPQIKITNRAQSCNDNSVIEHLL